MRKNLKVLLIVLGIIFVLSVITFYFIKQEPVTIGELAYDVNRTNGYTIFIKENNQYIPFLVLTNNYNGHTLLLRKEIIEQECKFSPDYDDDNDYYAVSYVDSYLNSEYYDGFSDSVKEIIVDSKLQITKDYPDIFDVEEIKRKVFLLSATEINIDLSISNVEGKPLKYFANGKNRRCERNGQYFGWWLRSNYIPERSMVWCVSSEGVIGGLGTQYSMGVRPTFCVPSSMKIMSRQISPEIEGYVLSIDE